MIIWLNGAFGSGKTTCAYELFKRINNCIVYDPENIGFFLRNTLSKVSYKEDFQDYEYWRKFNFDILKYLYENYKGTIIVPMTIKNYDYYSDIILKLKNNNINIKHFILYANKCNIEKRLRKRFEFGNTFAKKNIDECINFFDKFAKDEKIFTDEKNIDEVIEEIALKSNIKLNIDKRNFLKKKIDRFLITLKHLR